MTLKEVFRFIKPYIENEKKYLFLFFVLSLVISLFQAAPAEVTKRIFDIGFAEKKYKYIVFFSLVLVVLYLFKSLISYFLSKKTTIFGQNIIKQIRKEYFRCVINSDYGFYTEKDSVYINERLNEINNISGIFSSGMWDIVISFIQSIFVLLILIKINYILLLIMIIPISAIYVFSNMYVSRIANSSNSFLEEGVK